MSSGETKTDTVSDQTILRVMKYLVNNGILREDIPAVLSTCKDINESYNYINVWTYEEFIVALYGDHEHIRIMANMLDERERRVRWVRLLNISNKVIDCNNFPCPHVYFEKCQNIHIHNLNSVFFTARHFGLRRSRLWYPNLKYIVWYTEEEGKKVENTMLIESNITPIQDFIEIDMAFYEYADDRQLAWCEEIINKGVNDTLCSDGQINPPIVAKNSSISLYDCDMSYVSSKQYNDNTSTVLIAQECEINIHNCKVGTMLVRDTICKVYDGDTEIQTLMLCGNDNHDIPSIERANIFRYAVDPTSQDEEKMPDVPQYTLTIIQRNVQYPREQ